MLKCCSVSCARVARNNARQREPGGHEKAAAGLRQRRLYSYSRGTLLRVIRDWSQPYSREVKERFPLMRHPPSGYFGCDVSCATRALALRLRFVPPQGSGRALRLSAPPAPSRPWLSA